MADLNRRTPDGLQNSELTPELHSALVEARRTSRLFDAQVALRCGVEARTLRRWLQMGVSEDAQEPFLSFARDYSDASVAVEDEALEDVKAGETGKMGGPHWQSAAWFLERWKPRRWGKCVPEAGPVEDIDMQVLADEAEKRATTLAELFDDPPLELEKAMRQNREKILALLQAPDELPE